jgi:hypothetical protein
LLLDAGEGTLGAIQRTFGEAEAGAVLAALACIWISHKHADHMLGVPALLEARTRAVAKLAAQQGSAGKQAAGGRSASPGSSGGSSSTAAPHALPLLLVGPRELHDWLSKLSDSSSWDYQMLPVDAFAGLAPPVREQQVFWMQCQSAYAANGSHQQPQQQQQHQQQFGVPTLAASAAAGAVAALPQQCPPDKPRKPWCIQMQRQQLAAWQDWQRQCFAASPVAAVMCGLCGFTRWQSVAVNHCHGAHGLVLEHSQGWKLVYSGDTRPCPALVEAGRGATLLIHEATFDAELQRHATAKAHSTLPEALGVAKQMCAYRCVCGAHAVRASLSPCLDSRA